MIPTCRLYLIREHTTGDRIPRETRNKTLFFNYRVINTARAYTCRQLAITQPDVITTWEEYYYNRIHNICLTARYTCPNTYTIYYNNSDTNNIFYEKTFGARIPTQYNVMGMYNNIITNIMCDARCR